MREITEVRTCNKYKGIVFFFLRQQKIEFQRRKIQQNKNPTVHKTILGTKKGQFRKRV